MAKDMQYYYAQLRRIEEHREKSAEKEIRKVYKTMLTDLQHFISDEYVKLAEDGQLTYEILRGKNEYARFLDEVEKRLNGISPKVSKEIRTTVNEMYKLSYDGMVDAVRKSTSSDALRAAFKGVKGATPEMIKAAVENPVAGLTLNDTLEKNRRDIIYNIKKQIGIGLTAGDRMSTMARRIADSLDGDYKKAVRVARTEVHRVRETGHNDCVEEIDKTLQNGTTSLRMVKIWRTMKDERVRPQQRVKTKGGWKTVIRGNADHMKMEGQTVLADELFDLGGGLKAKAPGQSGDASNDINCRCTVEYVLMSDEEYFKATGKHFATVKTKTANKNVPNEYSVDDFKRRKGAGDFELTEDVKDMWLSEGTREKIDSAIETVRTAQNLQDYLKEKGYNMEIVSPGLVKRKDVEIESVKSEIDYVIAAVNQYEELGGLKAIKKICFWDSELETQGCYTYCAIGEKPPKDDGYIYLSNRMNGFQVMHEFAHAWADSTKPDGEDAVTWSAKLNKLAGLSKKSGAYMGAASEAYEAERFADAIGGAIAYGKEEKRKFLANVANVIKKGEK